MRYRNRPPSVLVYKAHELADKIEDLISRDYDEIESIFVHIEPMRQGHLSIIMPVEEINGLDSKIHGHFGRAPYFIIVQLDGKGGAEIEDFYYNEFLGEKDRIEVKVIKAVIRHGLDVVFTSKIGEISFYMLKDNFISIYRAQAGLTVREILDTATARLSRFWSPIRQRNRRWNARKRMLHEASRTFWR